MTTDPIICRTLIAAAVIHLIFAVLPGIDLQISALFYDGTHFPVQETASAQALRQLLWHLSLLVPLALMVWCGAALLANRAGARDRAAQAAVQLGFLIVGPGLFVNEVLKVYWGRARPQDVTEFGGAAQFSPPLEIAGECARNCSFVSGEVAMAVGAALVAYHLVAPAMTRRGAQVFGIALVLLCLASAYLRVAMGRHFMSDAIFAALFMIALHRAVLMLAPRSRQDGTPILIAALTDCRMAWALTAAAIAPTARSLSDRLSPRPRPIPAVAADMRTSARDGITTTVP